MSSLTRSKKRGIPLLSTFSVLALVISASLLIYELLSFTQREDHLPGGVTVAGVHVGSLTEIEAEARIEEAFSSPITLYYQDAPINLNPDTLGFEVNTAVMMASARASGESGSGFWGRFLAYLLGREATVTSIVELEANYQQNVLREFLEEIARIYDKPAGNISYDVESLTIQQGETGYRLDVDAAIELIDAALRSNEYRAVDLPTVGGESSYASIEVLEELIRAYLDSIGFIYDGQNSVASVYILDLQTGQEVNIQGDVAYSAASTNKVPIMLDLYRTLNREPDQDEAFLLANSLLCSANSSSNRIMNVFLGAGNIYSGIGSVTNTAQHIGARNTYLTAPFVEGVEGQEFGSIQAPTTSPNPDLNTYPDSFNQTTAEDMGTMFTMIYDCAMYGSGLITAYPDGSFNQQECRQMLELTSANDLNRLLQAGIPADVRISHKNGWLPGLLAGAQGATTGDAGVVFSSNGRDYVISVYIWEQTDGTGFDRWPIIEEISRATWNYFNPEQQLHTRRSDLPNSAQECLSRDETGAITYQYLPPYGSVDLNNINGWRDGSPTTPQPLPGAQ